jgi:glycosyltransferase involved in cell wall biosynthesis
MSTKELTIIIPFLNEKHEVENTLRSIVENSNGNIEIIIINDASDDGFDYQSIAEKYSVTYIINQERLGVAASRDLGVELCKTPYFLLLDSHMRFYDVLWVQRIVDELKYDERTLLCCQTKALTRKNGLLLLMAGRQSSYGAYLTYNNMEPIWTFAKPEFNEEQQTTPIACVLGAGYACSKKYWQHLKGLDGLQQYGNDEPYISMKVWLEGGTCKLLKDVIVGHIYRPRLPYSVTPTSRLYNRLLIISLLLPTTFRKNILSQIRPNKQLPTILLLLHDNREHLSQLKKYYQKIFTRDFLCFEEINNKVYKQDIMVDDINDVLSTIATRAEQQSMQDIGLLKGRMGLAIFLFHYAQFSEQEQYTALAEKTLEELLKDIKADTHYSFATGLSGIGWGIEYLHRRGFVEGDTSEILEDFDKKVMEVNPLRAFNLSRDYGLGGIVLYLLARLYTIEVEGNKNPFDSEYLASVCERIKTVVEQRDISCDCLDVFLEFMYYYEEQQPIEQPEIYDAWCLLNPVNMFIQDLPLGLQGAAGVGLKLILEHNV